MWSQRNLLSFLTTSRNAVHGKGGCLAPDDPRTARRSGHQSCRRLSSMCILESDYCTSAPQDGDGADCAKNVAPLVRYFSNGVCVRAHKRYSRSHDISSWFGTAPTRLAVCH